MSSFKVAALVDDRRILFVRTYQCAEHDRCIFFVLAATGPLFSAHIRTCVVCMRVCARTSRLILRWVVEFGMSAARDAVVRDSVAARRDETRRERRARANALARSTACHVGAISSRSICRSGSVQLRSYGPDRSARLEIAPSPSTADGSLIMELTERLTFDSISNCLAI